MAKNQVIFDATLLSTLMSCPCKLDYRFNRLLVPVGGKSNSLEAGSLGHYILEYFYKGINAGGMRSDAIKAGFDAGKEYIAGYKPTNKYILDPHETGVNMPPESVRIEKTDLIGYNFVLETMEGYFDVYRSDSFIPILVEGVKGKIIYEDDDIVILWKAKFDLIADFSNGVIPMDHKTGKQNRTPGMLNNQFIGQCLLTGSRNIIINQIGFQKSMKIEERLRRLTISYTSDKMTEWANDIVPYYARMFVAYTEAQSFPRNFTQCETKYGWCDFKNACEVDRSIREDTLKMNFKIGKKWDISND